MTVKRFSRLFCQLMGFVMFASLSIWSSSTFAACNDVVTGGLIACYPFDGNANDASGKGNNGTVNGATLTTDRFGKTNSAYSFNGINNVILANNPFALTTTNTTPLSVSVWINTTSTKDAGGIVTQHTACNNEYDDNFHITLYGTSPNSQLPFKNQLQVDAFKGQRAVVPRAVVADGKWHHVTLVYSQDKQTKLYIDGGSIQSSVYAPPVSSFVSTNRVAIGGFVSNSCSQNHNFQGQIDDVRIYNRAITETEVKQLYNEPTCAPANYINGMLEVPSIIVSGVTDVYRATMQQYNSGFAFRVIPPSSIITTGKSSCPATYSQPQGFCIFLWSKPSQRFH